VPKAWVQERQEKSMGNQVVPSMLRNRYVDSFPTKAEALSGALNAVETKLDAVQVRGLRELAHKLAGSAGMYGFDDLGLLAREIVRSIDSGAPISIIGGYTRELVGHLQRTPVKLPG